jgi:hypothetical protein
MTTQWLIPPFWSDNREDIFPGERLVSVLMGVDVEGVFHVLDVVYGVR